MVLAFRVSQFIIILNLLTISANKFLYNGAEGEMAVIE